jgi:signal transduction histidine kinase
MQDAPRSGSRFDRLLVIAVYIFQALAALAFLAMPLLAIGYFNTPFLGAFFDSTMVNNGVSPTPIPAHWDLMQEGIGPGDQLIMLDGQPVTSAGQMQAILQKHIPGETIPAVINMRGGDRQEFQVTLSTFDIQDRITYFYVPYFVGLIYLILSWWIFGLRRSETTGRAFTVFATSAAIGAGILLDVYATHRMIYLWSLALPLIGAGLVNLALVFPEEARIVQRYPRLRNIMYIPALILAIAAAVFAYDIENPFAILTVWRYSYILVGLCVLLFIGIMVYRRLRSASPIARQQSTAILWGALISFGPITFWFLSNVVKESQNFNPYILLFVAFFPAFTAYAVMRYRALRTDYVVSRGLVYSLLVVLSVGAFILLNLGLGLIFGNLLPANNPLLIGITVVLLVLLLEPLRARIQTFVDSRFFRGQRAYQERIQTFSRQLTGTVELPGVLAALREQVTTTMLPDRLHIYLYEAVTDQFAAAADGSGRPTSDVRFNSQSPVPANIRQERLPLYLDIAHLPPAFEPERTRLALLGAALFVALPGRARVSGWLAIGNRRSGETYSSADLAFLESICSQAALAIERAQIITDMERRVHEMNVLSRVAQGVNITLTFDDILELIYAQAAQVVPGSDFRLTLHNRAGDYFFYAFYLESDERLNRFENMPLPPKSNLDQEVVIQGRGLLTQDYLRECQIQGVSPSTQGIYAWIGVPMNAGAETIGALSIGSRDPSVLYTSGQMDLLQSIADQAASAIVKARLLQETERRAFQLSTLNDITRQLASTLELGPLLQNILDSAVSIINCEAGSLFLVDEQTDELVFSVTVGPVASNLAGQRLPAGSGVVGRAVTTRAPVLINEAQASPQWNASPDRQTGFVTRAILAAPMEVKDRIIGVIEIINKKDGLPFGHDDEELLTAFGGQAAVAIENARLYTLTDQQLAARVEELSVMQRIDRELNASLEIERALRITLEWAMRQSGAEAGLIGILEEGGMRLMAHKGYGEALAPYEQAYIPLDHPALSGPLASGQAERTVFEADGPGARSNGASLPSTAGLPPRAGFLNDTRSQLVIPIRREAKAIGLFVLESAAAERFAEQAQSFLSRLSDHAAIAISNAQLYAEVQAANNAKSEFVSFVAHELKNPMTSIKGYTELLAAGAVGPINEMQTNFLTTIKSNVERMSTLVSDLNDNSKIEAGKLRLEFKAVAVTDIVDEVLRSTRRQVEEKKQAVNLNLPHDLPKVWADPTRTAQVLTNLVSNAHKYTPAGGEIAIGAERAKNEWDPEGASEVVHVWVRDNGIGISPEDQAKIFQKFFRSDDSKAREAPGTGLGLNITKSLTEMQGGRIWFESQFRAGTTFHITIPVSEN